MKVENIGVVPPAVNDFRKHLAEGFNSPNEMVKEGKKIGDQGFVILAAGLGGMLVGGSIDALAGKRDQLYGAGRAVWGAGAITSAVGIGRITQGETIKATGEKIQKAIKTNRARIK